MREKMYVGFDVAGTKIAAGLVTQEGRIIGRAKTSTPKNGSPAKIIRIISDLFEEVIDSGDAQKKDIAGVGIGVPGMVNAKGVIVRTPNMHLSGAQFKTQLEKKLKRRIALGNDVNLGILGEKWLGAAQHAHNVVGFFVGTGVGGGIISNGKLLTGSHGAAGELGHMIIQDNGPLCSCGNQGCLEALCGRWAIERDIKKAIAQGKKTIVTKLIDGKIKTIKSRVLKIALRKKDPLVTKIMAEASRHLAIACISARHIFDPEIIILGGGVLEACGNFMLPLVQKQVKRNKFFSTIGACRVVSSRLKDDAIILGAVALLLTQHRSHA